MSQIGEVGNNPSVGSTYYFPFSIGTGLRYTTAMGFPKQDIISDLIS